ncbi:MAG: DUF2779 domain-containing protein [Bacteriovoracaceae bacterium]|nr:DUF2779 domain-containing protein [Bacteriovoracaceae bacterium]
MRYLTKSRFKLGLECPTKLYYFGKADQYTDSSLDNEFLQYLARGGFQVGALAKAYYTGGIEIEGLNHEEALAKTKNELQKENVILYEPAIRFENLFIRVDILVKKGNVIDLIEVKAKSFDPSTFEEEIWNKRELKKERYQLKSDWCDYIYDLAFQSYVIKKSYPEFVVNPKLMLADKSKVATVDSLNQRFFLKRNGRKTSIEIDGDISLRSLGQKILSEVDLQSVVDKIHNHEEQTEFPLNGKFTELVKKLSDLYAKDVKQEPILGSHCKSCQYQSKEEISKSGIHQCWKEHFKLSDQKLVKPLVTELWNNRNLPKQIGRGIALLEDLEKIDLTENESSEMGLTTSERQWLQIEKQKMNECDPFIDLENLSFEMNQWNLPWHFIDFETSTTALPFHSGRRPYETIAFQFSHHIMDKNGNVHHVDQFLEVRPNVFPNFEFVRSLRKSLGKTPGTIFRYASHEKTVLNHIKEQLRNSDEIDRMELMNWIDTFLDETKTKFVDLLKLVKKFFYHPSMKGSNSLKYVLPAIIGSSEFLQKKYSQNIYGTNFMKSLNFSDKKWLIKNSTGKFNDPYKELPLIYEGIDLNQIETLMDEDEIRNGGIAMMAYSILQFTKVSDLERQKISEALLRYCELDTLAMVMLVEYWKEQIKICKKSISSAS